MYIDPPCQAAPEWKAANKSGDLLLEIRCLAALNRHLARWWGHPNPGPAPWSADSDGRGNSIQLEQRRDRGPTDEYLDAGETEVDQDGGPFQGPPQGWIWYQRNSLLCRQSDLEVLNYDWIKERHLQFSNFLGFGYTYTIWKSDFFITIEYAIYNSLKYIFASVILYPSPIDTLSIRPSYCFWTFIMVENHQQPAVYQHEYVLM